MRDANFTIRPCHAIEEFEQMVELEAKVWGFSERDVVPSQMYILAAKIGGQVLGSFVGDEMVGFVLAYPGIREGRPYLHSHMAAVLPEFRNSGIGRELKLAQREDALTRGIKLIEWTFDPLQTRNAYFNICRGSDVWSSSSANGTKSRVHGRPGPPIWQSSPRRPP